MANNYHRSCLVYGNDIDLSINLTQYDGVNFAPIDLTQVQNLEVTIICSKHPNTYIPIEYTIDEHENNVLRCHIDFRLTHPNASYGIRVKGVKNGDNFRWEVAPREGFLIVSNTSGMKVYEATQQVDMAGRVTFAIETDLSDYYTKEQTNALLEDKQDELVSGENIKTINNESILGEGNITIEAAQANWNETDPTDPSYIQNKPNLATVATSGSYNDLSNTPTIPAAQVNSNWNETDTSSKAYIQNKPNLATVATSGSYNDLSNTPTLDGKQVNIIWSIYSGTRLTPATTTLYIDDIIVFDTNTNTVLWNYQSNPNQFATIESIRIYLQNTYHLYLRFKHNDITYWDTYEAPFPFEKENNSGVHLRSFYMTLPCEVEGRDGFEDYIQAGDNVHFVFYKDIEDEPIYSIDIPLIQQAYNFTQVQANWNETNTTSKAYIRNKPDLSIYAQSANLATVATSGSYNDLSNTPTIPAAQVQSNWNESDTTSKAYIQNKPNLATVATSGSYNDLSNKPTIPAAQVQSNWNETDNTDPSYIQNKPDLSIYAQSANLATVATSGSYNDLSNKPTIPAAQVNSNWNESDTTSKAYIQNKPDLSIYAQSSNLATVATSGSYNDLSNTPTIPAAQVQSNWNESDTTSKAYIQNKPDLTTYATRTDLGTKQDKLVAGTNIVTINNKTLLQNGDIHIGAISGMSDYYEQIPFTILPAQQQMSITFTKNANATGQMYYRISSSGNWQAVESGVAISASAWSRIEFKGNMVPNQTGGPGSGIGTFSSTGPFQAEGNIMSLCLNNISDDDFTDPSKTTLYPRQFAELFISSEVNMVDNLILPDYTTFECFRGMFYNCYDIQYAPKIFAKHLADYSCYVMFANAPIVLLYCAATSVETQYAISGILENNNESGMLDCPADSPLINVLPQNWSYEINDNIILSSKTINVIEEAVNRSVLATVATTGSYYDLYDEPTDLSSFNNDVGYVYSTSNPGLRIEVVSSMPSSPENDVLYVVQSL